VLFELVVDKSEYIRKFVISTLVNRNARISEDIGDIQTYRKLLTLSPIYMGAVVAFDKNIPDDLRWNLFKSRRNHPVLLFTALYEDLSEDMKYKLIGMNIPVVNKILQLRNDLTDTQEVTLWV
jgi:hypothetical protein